MILLIIFIGVCLEQYSLVPWGVFHPKHLFLEKTNLSVVGTVAKIESQTNQKIYLKDVSVQYDHQQYQVSQIIIYNKNPINMKLGNKIRAQGEVSYFEEARNPGNFDMSKYYDFQKISFALWTDHCEIVNEKYNLFRENLWSIRKSWNEMIECVLDKKQGSVLCAVMLGEKDEIDAELKELYQVNGIAHVLAISGLHLSFLGIGLYQWIRKSTGSIVWGGVLGSSFLLLYIAMIGLSVSVLRAYVMFVIRVGADMVGRKYDMSTSLAVAAVTVIIWRPLAFFDAGFQLSFGAILGLMFIYPLFEKKKKISEMIGAGCSIQIATIPVMLWHYYYITIYSVLTNLVIVPLMSILLICGFGGSILHYLFGIGDIFLKMCGMILKLYEKICEFGICLPGYRWVLGRPKGWTIVAYYLLLFFVLLMVKKNKMAKPVTQRILVLGVLMLVAFSPRFFQNDFQMTFLDVGQGDGIFLKEKNGICCLMDGGSSDVSEVGRYRIEPYLLYNGIDQIDYIFVSHGDSDHISGIEELIRREKMGISIACVVFPSTKVWDDALFELWNFVTFHLFMSKLCKCLSCNRNSSFPQLYSIHLCLS